MSQSLIPVIFTRVSLPIEFLSILGILHGWRDLFKSDPKKWRGVRNGNVKSCQNYDKSTDSMHVCVKHHSINKSTISISMEISSTWFVRRRMAMNEE